MIRILRTVVHNLAQLVPTRPFLIKKVSIELQRCMVIENMSKPLANWVVKK